MKKNIVYIIGICIFLLSSCVLSEDIYYTINYYSKYGEYPDSLILKENTLLSTDELPELEYIGSNFLGWYMDDFRLVPGKYKLNKNINIQAKWLDIREENKKYRINYYSKFGNQLESIELDANTILGEDELPELEYDNYKFLGWFIDDFKLVPGEFCLDMNINIQARWKSSLNNERNNYIVNYFSEYGEQLESIELPSNTLLRENVLPDLYYDGYVFLGWYINDFRLVPGKFILDSDINIIAKWLSITEENETEIKLDNLNFTTYTDSYKIETLINDDLYILDFSNIEVPQDIENCIVKIPYFNCDGRESGFISYDITQDGNGGGVLLSFDDYFTNWNDYIQKFYDSNIKATFFCRGYYSDIYKFCLRAQNLNLEVGFHTRDHKALTLCDNADEVKEQAILPLVKYRDNYINFDSFAFPNGLYLPYQVDMLKDYYKMLRLFDNHFHLYTFEEMGKQRIIWSQSIDKNKFKNDEDFKSTMLKRLLIAKITGKVYPCTSHYFLSPDDTISTDAYTISDEKLEWLFYIINKMKINSYLFKDIYPYIYD